MGLFFWHCFVPWVRCIGISLTRRMIESSNRAQFSWFLWLSLPCGRFFADAFGAGLVGETSAVEYHRRSQAEFRLLDPHHALDAGGTVVLREGHHGPPLLVNGGGSCPLLAPRGPASSAAGVVVVGASPASASAAAPPPSVHPSTRPSSNSALVLPPVATLAPYNRPATTSHSVAQPQDAQSTPELWVDQLDL